MKSKDELKDIDIKNRTCYYFDDVMRTWDTNNDTSFSGILLDFNRCKAIAFQVRHNKIDEFVKTYNKIRYLVLFVEWCDQICDRIKYRIKLSKKVVLQIILILILQ